MTTDADVMFLFERANPVPDPDAIDIVVSADERLATVVHEEHSTMTLIEPTATGTPAPDRRRWLIPAAAAAVLIIVLVAGLAIFGADETAPSDSVPPTTSATTVPEESAAQPTAADLAVIDAFFTAYNAGDTDAVLAMTVPGLVVTENYGAGMPDPDNERYVDWDRRLAWNNAQGEILTEPECRVVDDQPSVGAALTCEYETSDAVILAAEGAPVPIRTRFIVLDGTITEIHQGYGLPDFATLGTPFEQWMDLNHPEVAGALFHEWTSSEEAVEHGRLRAQWAQAWAGSLDEPEEAIVVDGVVMAPTLPAPTSGETQQTIVGDITWTRLDGDVSTQPQRVHTELLGEFYGSDDDGTNWRSPDGINWTKSDSPIDPTMDTIDVQGETWAVQFHQDPAADIPPELVHWNGATFETYVLPPSGAPTVDGMRRSGRSLSLADSGDSLVVLVNEWYDVAWNDLFGPGMWMPEYRGDGTIELRNYTDGGSARLGATVDEAEPGRVAITEDGRTLIAVGPWPGVDSEELMSLLRNGGVSHDQILVGGVGGFDAIPAPPGVSVTGIAVLDDALLALTGAPDSQERDLWVSDDGVTWERRDLPTASGGWIDFVSITGDGDSALLTIVSSQPGQVGEAWHTTDGKTWQVANGGESFGDARQAEFGWISENLYEESPGISVSPDGITWQKIEIFLPEPAVQGGGGSSMFGNTMILSMFETGGKRVMWVGQVDPG